MPSKPTYYEFFAGGGMARAGLGDGWRCLFANDFDAKKAETYRANWGGDEFFLGDVRKIETSQLPGIADLVWASFPCQDLSLAGARAGLAGERSGTFWPFFDLVRGLRREDRAPRLLAFENVCGTLTSHGGKDFEAICEALADEGYRYGALVVDAALFVPQSRPRLFIVAADATLASPQALTAQSPAEAFHPPRLQNATERLSDAARRGWVWWRLPSPPRRNVSLAELLETNPPDVAWRSHEETLALVSLMNKTNRDRLTAAQALGRPAIGAVYRRTRSSASGVRSQRAEARFDGLSGCLRTPAGGSSRQFLLFVEGAGLRSRLISARETARLMGLPDDYLLPRVYNDAYHLTGDGVVAPVVRHLSHYLLEPLLHAAAQRQAA
ncbi:DNA cytosine methyltransferase [Methylocystis bryophila]|uniref:DNA cytosine methyltransferase n=1 Tax=Methylocystis bryophila TaxID=655015 RepID=UPI001FD91704|nr:DNA cytosine methyltransferase [Methylocystis bryophila]BDV38168.1 DNA (cytosine-5-)-methyltransferase [Methylocystis bryophila]